MEKLCDILQSQNFPFFKIIFRIFLEYRVYYRLSILHSPCPLASEGISYAEYQMSKSLNLHINLLWNVSKYGMYFKTINFGQIFISIFLNFLICKFLLAKPGLQNSPHLMTDDNARGRIRLTL